MVLSRIVTKLLNGTLGCGGVDVWRLVAHHPPVVGADIERADVVAPDDQDVIKIYMNIAS
jgi:hypothetical protein